MTNPIAGFQAGPVGFFSLPEDFDPAHEARGVLWMWEMPRRDATYVIGFDPTYGITGWTPWNATQDDHKTDNAAIEVIRIGGLVTGPDGKPYQEKDTQVAEWAAPVDYACSAATANAIGKLYRGTADEEGCLLNLETTGPGLAVFPVLWGTYGYTNQFIQKYLDSPAPQRKINYGFWASKSSNHLLWQKGVRHIWTDTLKINSPWLLEEIADANALRFVAGSRDGEPSHDDRFRALLLAIWAGHDFRMDLGDVENTDLKPIQTKVVNNQKLLISSAEASFRDAEWYDSLLESIGE